MREWRKSHPLAGVAKTKDNCRSYSSQLVKRGKIVREGCIVAGCSARAEMHHEDYSNPWNVMWICREHHSALHNGYAVIQCVAA